MYPLLQIFSIFLGKSHLFLQEYENYCLCSYYSMKMFRVISILLILPHFVYPQNRLKEKSNEIKPIDKFDFLIDSHKFVAANTIRLEQMDILVGIDFSEVKWKSVIDQFQALLDAFPNLEFFKDTALMENFAGLCWIGKNKFNQFHDHMTEIFRFKDEKTIDTPINTCSKTPIEIKLEDLERELLNLNNRFKAINAAWTPDEIRASVQAQGILYEFCSYYNDFSIVYEGLAEESLTALEQLSDGNYPEVLFGELIRNCNYSLNGEGERFSVIACQKTNKGYRCQIEILQSVDLKEYIRVYPVHYNSIRLKGYSDHSTFGRTLDVHGLKYLECNNLHSGDYDVCIEYKVPEKCEKALASGTIKEVINNCNFTMEIPPVGTVLPNGGLLIQGENLDILNGQSALNQEAPIVVYSPNTITVKSNEEDYLFTPAIQVDHLVVVESKLTKEDIENLVQAYEWDNFWDKVEVDDYIRYSLVLLQLIIFPIAIAGCYFTITQRKLLKKLQNKSQKLRGSENLRHNQYLLKRMK